MMAALEALAVSVPWSMSRAASTISSLYSSACPRTSSITSIGRWSVNWLTRSARPSRPNSLTRRLLCRLMARRTPRWSIFLIALLTAPRSRSRSAPSAKEQIGCHAKRGVSGWSGAIVPSWISRQRRELRV